MRVTVERSYSHCQFIAKLLATTVLILFILPKSSSAQESNSTFEPVFNDNYYDSLLNAYLTSDSLLIAELDTDSTSILDLLEDLISLSSKVSSFSYRIGFNSHVLNAGRDFGFKQFGFSGGLSYYHKSGLFTDVTGYLNSDMEPSYNLTSTSLGYMGSITPSLSFIASYDHYFYNSYDDEIYDSPLTNALNASTYLDLKWASVGLDYGFLFGAESANRIRPSIAGVFRFKNIGFVDRITLMPGASVLWGNQTILISNTSYQLIRQLIEKIGIRQFRLLYRYNPEVVESLIFTTTEVQDTFGLMNYSLNFPLYIYIDKLSLMASYSLNIPKSLPGEDLDLSTNSYFSLSFAYSLYFGR